MSMSKFASQADYWKDRAERAEAKLAELEGQEPVGEIIHSDVLAGKDGVYRHELLCDFRLGVQTELYARPVPAEEGIVTVTTNDAGRCVMVSRQDEDHRILKVLWEAKDTPTEPAPLTDEEIREELRVFGKGGLVLRIARIIEAAIIRKNGFTEQE